MNIENEKERRDGFEYWYQIPYSTMLVCSDIAKRISKCRVCTQAIPKKTRRILVFQSFSQWQKLASGSGFNCIPLYFHVECWTPPVEKRRIACVHCGARTRARVSLVSRHLPVCRACANKRYLKCDSCSWLVAKPELVTAYAQKRLRFGSSSCPDPDKVYALCRGCFNPAFFRLASLGQVEELAVKRAMMSLEDGVLDLNV